jgi:hypothetical protein
MQANSTPRPNLLSGSAVVAGTHRNDSGGLVTAAVRLAPNSFISIQDIPDSSMAIVAHSYCTMPGAYKSCVV